MKIDWNDQDEEAARVEGWFVSPAHGSDRHEDDEPHLEMSAIEEFDIFDGDGEVWNHVCAEALSGSRLHMKALRYVAQNDLREKQEIMNAVSFARRAFDFAEEAYIPSAPTSA
ncbi:hypothetical protein [Croceicoccus gelatinilyticus]|uniref:hypothetical protein n=1 Tax=Croceicoccus gelatinilyticus TaxID=2835536 RepID=UPI001BCF4CAC|nr:hypothetical protein [Croceicoccus gelatinilyticus]MBS7671510.1 hypothetical protein [Croceicoccus gelatinilyticus]